MFGLKRRHVHHFCIKGTYDIPHPLCQMGTIIRKHGWKCCGCGNVKMAWYEWIDEKGNIDYPIYFTYQKRMYEEGVGI